MRNIYIEPRNIGKTLKVISLYNFYKNKGGCLIFIPKLKMIDIYKHHNIDKKHIVTKQDDIVSKKAKTLLVDEYFFLSDKQKEVINDNMFLFDNIMIYGTPDKFYPKDLVSLFRKNKKHLTTEGIIYEYLKLYPYIYKYKNQLIEHIKTIKDDLITNPDFQIINTVISLQLNEGLKNSYNDIYSNNSHELNMLGHYLIDDHNFWNNKIEDINNIKLKF